jgi:K+-sensing histidine kinase KdpD
MRLHKIKLFSFVGSRVDPYIISFLFCALSTLVQWLLSPWLDETIFIFYFPAVIASALIGGLGSGFFAAALSLLTANFLFADPAFSFSVQRKDLIQGTAFLWVTSLMTIICHRLSFRESLLRARGEEKNSLDTLRRIGMSLTSQLDLRAVLQTLTDETTKLAGAQFGAFFYNVVGEANSYRLYNLAGVSREKFSHLPMPSATELFRPTFKGEGIIRLDDVTQDERFAKNAPYYGLPPGHLSVRSYLAVPVISRKEEVLGALLFGHERVGVFSERTEKQVASVAVQAAVAIDNARLFRDKQRAIQEQTKSLEELKSINRELGQFAYVASHDLKEPLRMVTLYTDFLKQKLKGQLDDSTQLYMNFIHEGARRMTRLVDGLLSYSRTGQGEFERKNVDTDRIVEEVTHDLNPSIVESGIQVTQDPLPVILADEAQTAQLFQNLIQNAIKFRKSTGPTKLHISSKESDSEWILSFEDNGIGIDPKYADKIFLIFQRLHQREIFPGEGLGLAICKRIMERHNGRIWVESQEGKGSIFYAAFPKGTGSASVSERLFA